jgi:hypothetical protein
MRASFNIALDGFCDCTSWNVLDWMIFMS